jgi:hypothetical protein
MPVILDTMEVWSTSLASSFQILVRRYAGPNPPPLLDLSPPKILVTLVLPTTNPILCHLHTTTALLSKTSLLSIQPATTAFHCIHRLSHHEQTRLDLPQRRTLCSPLSQTIHSRHTLTPLIHGRSPATLAFTNVCPKAAPAHA